MRPTTALPKPGNARIPYTLDDSVAAGAQPQHYPNQEMREILCIFMDSAAAGAPPQHYPDQEMHEIQTFTMILERWRPTTRITQTTKFMELLCILNDYGTGGAPPQHYPNQ